MVVNGAFDANLSGWTTGAGVTSSWVAGEAQITGGGKPSGTGNVWFTQSVAAARYREYKIEFDATFVSGAGTLWAQFGFASSGEVVVGSAENAGVKTRYSAYLIADSVGTGTPWASLVFGASAGSVWKIDNVSVKEVSPRNANQATASFRPKFQAVGATFDGNDDNLLTDYTAGPSANFIVAKVTVPASISVVQVIAGAAVTAANRIHLAVLPTGRLTFGAGSLGVGAVTGTTDLRGQTVVVGMTCDARSVCLFAVDTIEATTGYTGGLAPTMPFRIGAVNSNHIATNFFGGSIARLVAGREFIDLDTFNKIAAAL